VDDDQLSERLIDWMTANRLALSWPSSAVVMVATESVRHEVIPLFFLFLSVPFRFFSRANILSVATDAPPPRRPAPVGHGRARSHAAGVRAPSMTVATAAEEKSVEPGGAVRHYTMISLKYVLISQNYIDIISKALNFSKNIPFFYKHPFFANNSRRGASRYAHFENLKKIQLELAELKSKNHARKICTSDDFQWRGQNIPSVEFDGFTAEECIISAFSILTWFVEKSNNSRGLYNIILYIILL